MVIHPQARTTPRLRAEIKAQHDPNLLWSPSTRPIDWDRLIAKRPTVLATIDDMPAYLLKPEVLALTPSSFVDDGYDFGVILKTLKQRPGRPSKKALQRSPKRYVPILDRLLQDRI
ncbi:hypothetical protein, partial [Thiolapillus sp.]|uniref:hypothetical protein n=1 Tax=Thiolapillus sp. TaxID=2017437 RepID=UPI003AF99E85